MRTRSARRIQTSWIFFLLGVHLLACKVDGDGTPGMVDLELRDAGAGADTSDAGADGASATDTPAPDAADAADGNGDDGDAPGAVTPDGAGPVVLVDAAELPADAGADAVASVVPPARCDTRLPLPASFRGLQDGPRGDDIAFDHDGHLVSFNGQNVVRVVRGSSFELLVPNVIGSRGGALRAVPGGDLFLADFERDAVFVYKPGSAARRLPTPVASPMKMVRGPRDALYITGKRGVIFRVDPASGAITQAATTTLTLGGLSFSSDYKTLYVGTASPGALYALDVQVDGSLAAPRLSRSQVGNPVALAADECGNLYFISEEDGRVRRISAAGQVELVADLRAPYLWSLGFGSGKQGWSDTALYVQDAGSGRLFEIPLGVAGQAAPPAP